ncbi:hypothetical protein LCGC14_0392230 [marine sediment metagenome]|uniref:Uncharacterized protein n=1 Tax=marine sediment metagenome TaxID=412755 RepID=A0A0F9T562_9ZZZZ
MNVESSNVYRVVAGFTFVATVNPADDSLLRDGTQEGEQAKEATLQYNIIATDVLSACQVMGKIANEDVPNIVVPTFKIIRCDLITENCILLQEGLADEKDKPTQKTV